MTTSNPLLKKLAFSVGGAFILVVAILLRIEQMYLMASVLLLIPFVLGMLKRMLASELTCERALPYRCAEGDRVAVTLRIGNTGRLPKFFMRGADRLPAQITLAGSDSPLILQLNPGEQRDLSYQLDLVMRGAYQIGPTIISATDPFGFTTFKKKMPEVQELLVLPTPLPTTCLFLQGGASGQRGDDGGSLRGDGLDFHGVREYRHGDDLRRVHWRTTARTGQLAVAEYTKGSSLEVLLALDLFRPSYDDTGDGPQSALEYGVKLAATVADNLARYGHRASLLTPATRMMENPPSNHPNEMSDLLEVLARAELTLDISLADMLESHRPRARHGVTLVLITPVVDGALVQAIRGYGIQGSRSFGIHLDGPSFHAAAHLREPNKTETMSIPGATWRRVRRGDDLSAAIEGLAHGDH